MSMMGQWIEQLTALVSTGAARNAGDTGIGATANGVEIDLRPSGRRYQSLKMLISYYALVCSGIAVTIAANLQDRLATSGTGSTWADFGTAPTSHTVTNSDTGNDTVYGEFPWNQDLRGARRYLRVQTHPSIATDTGGGATGTGSLVQLWAVATLLDANRLPASG